MDIILAIDKKYGIGKNGKIPWYYPDDLKLFKTLTLNSNIIMGRKTVETLPLLKNRKIYVLSNTLDNGEKRIGKNNCIVIKETNIKNIPPPIFIAGGAEIYNYFFREILLKRIDINSIHITCINIDYSCDTFIDKNKLFEIIQNHAKQTVEKILYKSNEENPDGTNDTVIYYKFEMKK
jgi:dihydrofolate reductase